MKQNLGAKTNCLPTDRALAFHPLGGVGGGCIPPLPRNGRGRGGRGGRGSPPGGLGGHPLPIPPTGRKGRDLGGVCIRGPTESEGLTGLRS